MRDTDESGTVTAEAAVVMPVVLLFTIGMAWLVSLGVTHVRAVDAARETARTVARGESVGAGSAVGRRVATAGSAIHVERGSRLVVVTVRSAGPGSGRAPRVPAVLRRARPGGRGAGAAAVSRRPGRRPRRGERGSVTVLGDRDDRAAPDVLRRVRGSGGHRGGAPQGPGGRRPRVVGGRDRDPAWAVRRARPRPTWPVATAGASSGAPCGARW